ncbi:MAG: cupin domain-containing protein [Planctomycetaceae bacterium]|nr:cupin domain-containing protein [Planctomycetaceae bacterium]
MAQKNKQKYSEKLGLKIKQIRMMKDLKVVDVARRTGLTSSTISQVERSKISPTIVTLKKIAAALEQPLGEFFGDQEEEVPVITHQQSPVVHKEHRKLLSLDKGVTYHLLNPDMSGPIEFIYNIYELGAGTGVGQYSHPGTECGLILQGQLLVTIREQEYLLKEGDSITFSSAEPHSKANTGEENCICVWANTPPWF